MLEHFRRVWGSPAAKPDVIRQVLRLGPYRKQEVVFVGDAESDWRAACQTGISFIRRVGSPAEWTLPPATWQMADLRSLSRLLSAIERSNPQ
jgi:phosphoglycolate phosphatase-like HAD superfamily hydrolase